MANGNAYEFLYFVDSQNAGAFDNTEGVDELEHSKTAFKRPYSDCLEIVRNDISKHHTNELAAVTAAESARILNNLISKYIHQNNLTCEGITDQRELQERIYQDMAGFGFLTSYIYDDDNEEININSWRDVEVIDSNGFRKITEHFNSPEQAIDMVKKMCRLGGLVIDGAQPVKDSYIFKGTRISAMIPPIIDEERGAVASIRRQKEKVVTYDGVFSDEEWDFLTTAVNNGISIAFGGATGSGKTTLMGCLLRNIRNDKRIYTIEDSRELNLEKEDENGNVINRVIHTKTRLTDDAKTNVSADMLLKQSLRQHPDIIVPAEMRGVEAWTAQEAGRTGHTIVTTLHTNSAAETYKRILTLCQEKGTNLSEDLIMDMIMDAFPIVVFLKQHEDGSRKCMEIIEPTEYVDKKLKYSTLFRYNIVDWTTNESGKPSPVGRFERCGDLSDKLARRMFENGVDIKILHKYAPNWSPERKV